MPEIKCTRCTMMIPADATICPCCGKKITKDTPAPISKSNNHEAETKKCRSCAMMIPKEARICPYCRKKVSAPITPLVWAGLIIFVTLMLTISQTGKKADNVPKNKAVAQTATVSRPVKQPEVRQEIKNELLPVDEKIENFVRVAIETGVVQKAELHNSAVTIYVRPVFNTLDYDQKNTTAAAFMRWARSRKTVIDLVMLRDSRDHKVIGNYCTGLGLRFEE